MSAGYDDWNSHWQSFGNSSEVNPAVLYRQNFLIRLIFKHNTKSGNLLLDIGCGTGSFLRKVEDLNSGLILVGIEPSVSGCERSTAQSSARIVQGDVLTLDPASLDLAQIADFAICSEVIEHLDNPSQFLQQCKKFIKPSGKIFLTVPGGWCSEYDKHIGHRQHFSKRLLTETLTCAGYKNIKIFRAGFPVFNIYKLMTILAGKKLIQTASVTEDHRDSKMIGFLSKAFNPLFKCSLPNFPFGWQLVAIAEIRE